MKTIFNKIKNRIKNNGSGLVLVIVALGFVGILTGALLTAVGYVYKLKLYDYNAKSNFYYLEQAMDEIYAGVGSQTMLDMQEAYEETRENIISYDVEKKTYISDDDDVANKKFKDFFMKKLTSSTFYAIQYDDSVTPPQVDENAGIVKAMKGMISNSSVKLVPDKMRIVKLDQNGEVYRGSTGQVLSKIVIKDVTLKRTAEYNRSQAKGTFTQTISSDIEISRPDFYVSFDTSNYDSDNLFSYCLVADSGVEINENPGQILTINGNVYAASDFYNKTYNKYDATSEGLITEDEFELTVKDSDGNVVKDSEGNDVVRKYKMNKVSNYTYVNSGSTTLRNSYKEAKVPSTDGYLYDGYDDNSKYSGFYIDGSNVNVIANYFVVPGSISVMNSGDLSVYGLNNSTIVESNVWADELVLAGYSSEDANGNKVGSSATINANLFVKDDTQLEADYSKFKLNGGYYGYSNKNTSDKRVFVPTTKKDKNNSYNIFQQVTKDGDVENRGHYNSSAIVVNSKHSAIDLTTTRTLYIAGRSYIEMSRQKADSGSDVNKTYTDVDGIDFTANGKHYTYEYDATTNDYKTGESISIKSSQIAYKPQGAPKPVNEYGVLMHNEAQADHFVCDIPSALGSSALFKKYFGRNEAGNTVAIIGNIPVIYRNEEVNRTDGTTKREKMYYIDFDYVADKELYDDTRISFPTGVNKADYLRALFIKDYFDYINYVDIYNDTGVYGGTAIYTYVLNNTDTDNLEDDDLLDLLNDVTYYEDYLAGEIALAEQDSSVSSYTSGVLTNTGNSIKKVDDENKYIADLVGTTEKADFNVITSQESTLQFKEATAADFNKIYDISLLGASSTSRNTASIANAEEFTKAFQKHYNYIKWSLGDLDEASDEAVLVDEIVTKNGEGSLTPINRFMNFDYITDNDSLMGATPEATEINPQNLDLGTYKVWVSNGDVEITAEDIDNHSITGMIIAKGDVYFKTEAELKDSHPTLSDSEIKDMVVNSFNGIIITGGKVYVNNDVTSISATDLCKNIINSCVTVASHANDENPDNDPAITALKWQGSRAARVLSLFKSYESLSKEALDAEPEGDVDTKSITNIDYSDVIRYNNWMRNVD
ncbi:hypothetical protein SAMN06297422_11149 [Lachnospiraceae bacterium]|nr:hypothetical protein SAMN06297422_11149 [Lachnospiraceae bacterium]